MKTTPKPMIRKLDDAKAWGITMRNGKLYCRTFRTRLEAREYKAMPPVFNGERVVRVVIIELPPACKP